MLEQLAGSILAGMNGGGGGSSAPANSSATATGGKITFGNYAPTYGGGGLSGKSNGASISASLGVGGGEYLPYVLAGAVILAAIAWRFKKG